MTRIVRLAFVLIVCGVSAGSLFAQSGSTLVFPRLFSPQEGELQSHNRADFANYHQAAPFPDVYFRMEVGRVRRQRVRSSADRSEVWAFRLNGRRNQRSSP